MSTEVPKPTPENSSTKTPYEQIRDLYNDLGVEPIAKEKKVAFQDNSTVCITRMRDMGDEKDWFEVNVNNVVNFRLSQEESLPDGFLELGVVPVSMQISNFVITRELYGDVVFIPREKREEVAGILTNWAVESIKENKVTKPPYNLHG